MKQKLIIKKKQTNLDCFLESNFVGVNRIFVLVYENQDAAFKRFKTKRYYLSKEIINNYNVLFNGSDSDINDVKK